MAMTRAAPTEAPEFDDMELDGLDRFLIPLMMPYVWLHGIVTAPFQYRRLLKTDRKIGLRPLTSDQVSSLRQPVHDFLDSMETAIGRIGFPEPVRHFNASRPQSSDAAIVITVAPSASGDEFCMVVISHAPRRLTLTGVSFHTRMTDGHVIVTANERRVVSTRPGNHDTAIFQKVTDVARLHEIHLRRKAIAVHGGRSPVTVGWHPPAMHPLEAYQRMFDETVDDGVRRGYIVPPATETVSVTFKGAVLAAWSSKWPLSQILDWREARRATRVLRAIQA